MADDRELDMWKNLRESQDKHTYFLLAAAGSAIAFSVHTTIGWSLSWSMVPLGAAVLCWVVSFWAGCRVIAYVNSNVHANIAFLQVRKGSHRDLKYRVPDEIEAASEGIYSAMESNARMVGRWEAWQMRTLIAGGAAFVAWHILEMALGTHVKS